MEFGQLMTDIRVYVSCEFEMYIFEIAQVIGENVPIAFLYVLSKQSCTLHPLEPHFYRDGITEFFFLICTQALVRPIIRRFY